jgi:hypothetical protein
MTERTADIVSTEDLANIAPAGLVINEALSQVLAAEVHQAIVDFGDNSQRSMQSQNHVLGVSDIGGCREYVRRMILDEPFSDHSNEYALASFVGHAVGNYAETVLGDVWRKQGRVDTQVEVQIALPNGVVLRGHPDLVGEAIVVDFKTVDGLAVVKQGGRTQHRWQVILYAAALIQMERLPENALCALVYIDRSGVEVVPHVEVWRYDPHLLDPINEWVNDVLYAIQYNEEASRDRPREWCYSACPYARSCRGMDTDVSGLIESEEAVLAVKSYLDAARRAKEADRDKKTAAAALAGVNGATDEHMVRWVHVNETNIEAFTKRGYDRLDIRPLPVRAPKRGKAKAERADDAPIPEGA